MQELKLHIGCGKVYKRGFINIDAYDKEVADVIAFADKLPYEDEAVDMIETHHVLEHFSYNEILAVFEEWYRVLKPGGKLIMEVPNLVEQMRAFLNCSYKERWDGYRPEYRPRGAGLPAGRIMTIYGSQENLGQFHRYGFDEEHFKWLLGKFNLVNIAITPVLGTGIPHENLLAVCFKAKNQGKEGGQKVVSEKFYGAKPRFKLIKITKKILSPIKAKLIFSLRALADVIDLRLRL